LNECHRSIDGPAREVLGLQRSVGPPDFNPIVVIFGESDVGSRVVAGEEAAGGVENPMVAVCAGDDGQFGSIGVAE
jgi:hypothetical protein